MLPLFLSILPRSEKECWICTLIVQNVIIVLCTCMEPSRRLFSFGHVLLCNLCSFVRLNCLSFCQPLITSLFSGGLASCLLTRPTVSPICPVRLYIRMFRTI